MPKKKNESQSTHWEQAIAHSRNDPFSCVIEGIVLIRRIPLNYEVLDKDHTNSPFYYQTLQDAIQKVIRILLDKKLKRADTLEKILKAIEKLDKHVEDVVPDFTVFNDKMDSIKRKKKK